MSRSPVDVLLQCLDLEAMDRDLFLGDPGPGEGRLFGGMVAAQCVMAAGRTVEEGRPLHSLHSYFLRPGRHDVPLRLVVDRIRDGRTFTTRRVVAHQGGEAIFNMSASFAKPEEGIAHQEPAPSAPPPEECEDWEDARVRAMGDESARRQQAVELRLVDGAPMYDPTPSEPRQRNWFRMMEPLPEDPLVHTAALVYATDRALLSTAARPHGLTWGKRTGASLDHAVWIHHPPVMDGRWLLYACESPAAHAARAICLGAVYDGDTRIASVAQEALIRVPRKR
ncbi:MAG: acyl-CoA thioesterase [Myxococcota bacterium]